MRIYVSDSDSQGGGTTPYQMPEGTRVQDFFRSYKAGADISKYKCVVDGNLANGSTSLSHDCRLTIGPAKLGGAGTKWYQRSTWRRR
jgi:hypothetical protein